MVVLQEIRICLLPYKQQVSNTAADSNMLQLYVRFLFYNDLCPFLSCNDFCPFPHSLREFEKDGMCRCLHIKLLLESLLICFTSPTNEVT